MAVEYMAADSINIFRTATMFGVFNWITRFEYSVRWLFIHRNRAAIRTVERRRHEGVQLKIKWFDVRDEIIEVPTERPKKAGNHFFNFG